MRLNYKKLDSRVKRRGFTIVELLIVIVVIGILAAITVVSYTGIQQQAAASGLKSEIKNASTQLELAKVQTGTYPSDDSALTKGDDTDFQYTLSGDNYCLSVSSAKAGTIAFHISSTNGTIEDGVCSGHTAPTGGGGGGGGSGVNQGIVTTLAGSSFGYVDGTGSAAKFKGPYGVAVDTSGNVYVADYTNYRIRKVTPAGVVTTLAGSTQGYANGTGAAAQFNRPAGIAVDSSGNVYVADDINHRIRKITPAGVVTTLAGSTQGYTEGTGAAAQFNYPYDVTVDTSGNVYVADNGNNSIRKITPGGVVTTLAGSATWGYLDGTGASAQFGGPSGVDVDSSGTVYVADQGNNCIRKITPAGVVTTLAGSTTWGYAEGTGAAAQFDGPRTVAVDASGNVYVADSGNNRIRKITPGGVVTTLAGADYGDADGTGAAAQFADPYGVAFDASSGAIYVADTNNSLIRKIE